MLKPRRQWRACSSCNAAIAQLALAGDTFRLTVGARVFDKRASGNESLQLAAAKCLASGQKDDVVTQLGTLKGFAVTARPYWLSKGVTLALANVPGSDMSFGREELGTVALVTRLENRLSNLPSVRAAAERDVVRVTTERERALAELQKPFRERTQLEAERARLRQLDEQLDREARPAAEPPAKTPAVEALVASSVTPTQRLAARLEREFARQAGPMPEGPVFGLLARLENVDGNRAHAVVVTENAVHLISVDSSTKLQGLSGRNVSIEKTPEGHRITAALERAPRTPDLELGR
jgi:hypothetical protein